MIKTKQQKRTMLLCVLLLTMLVFAAAIPTAALAADEDIVVLYTNDVHCGVDDNIGYAGLALYKQQMETQTPYVTLVDAGDSIQGTPIGTISDGQYLIDIMNQVGYDFAVPGNHEFDYGMSRFLELAEQLQCGYYAANFMDLTTGQPVFAPYKMMTYGDTKVAFVGAVTPESFTKSTPAYFQNEQGAYIYGFCEDESGQTLYDQIQKSVDAARAEGADFVILVAHLGQNGVTDRWSSTNVLQHTSGIDACIDGHSHEAVPAATVTNQDGKAVPLTQTGTKLAAIGKLTIQPDGAITTELVEAVSDSVQAAAQADSYIVQPGDSLSKIAKAKLGDAQRWTELYQANQNHIKNPNMIFIGMELTIPGRSAETAADADNADQKAVDAHTDAFIKAIQAKYSETLKLVLGHSDVNLTVNNPQTGERAVRNAETNLGDLTADAYRYVLGADIGFSNGGGIRADIAAGDITYNDTLAVFPYGNMGCVIEATGQQIKDALELASGNYPEESGGFLQVSGITYTIDSAVPSSVKTDEKGNFVKVDGAYRVTDIQINGQPLQEDNIYTVASHNYMLKSGGDGMTMFQGCNIIRDEVMTDVDILSQYINENLGGTVGEQYANPAGQGRIQIK